MFGDIDAGVNEVESEEFNNVGLIKAKSVTEIDAEQNKVKPPVPVPVKPVKPVHEVES